VLVSTHEEMNPSRRASMEDCTVYSAPGTWGAPDEDMAYLGIYDGHGGELTPDLRGHDQCIALLTKFLSIVRARHGRVSRARPLLSCGTRAPM